MSGMERVAVTAQDAHPPGPAAASSSAAALPAAKSKPHGRDFYRAIGQPRYIVAPMVDRSEFAWRMLTRSYLDAETSKKMLAYTPMLHARLFQDTARFRNDHFQPTRSSLETASPPSPETKPFLDGNPAIDRPLFVQFCANKPHELLAAARFVAPYCDAVDLNLGCPQGIARSGHYGAFLQEDWELIHELINTLHNELSIPVTAKMRILDTKEKTLEYAKMILAAGASILTVHGRRREQKGHNTGLADWQMIRYLRDNLPAETVLFANGNILNGGDLDECLRATGADGVMSAEGNLSDPTIFARPPSDATSREYWRSPTNPSVGGYRIDGVFRRYMDIIYNYVLEREPPQRQPLWVSGDAEEDVADVTTRGDLDDEQAPPTKKRKKDPAVSASPSMRVMQGHLFGLLKPMLAVHTDIRDKLARTRVGDLEGFEKLLSMVEAVTKRGLQEEKATAAEKEEEGADLQQTSHRVKERVPRNEGTQETTVHDEKDAQVKRDETPPSPYQTTTAKYRRPWWVVQPYIRLLPDEAIAAGAMTASSKKKKPKPAALTATATATIESRESEESAIRSGQPALQRSDDDDLDADAKASQPQTSTTHNSESTHELPQPALVCG